MSATGTIMNGAQIFVECLKREGVTDIFGYPGGAVLKLYDALYDSDIRHWLCRHEQGASHMADGYYRASGKVGVVLVTSGPGATNTVTGLATAMMDSIPMIVFSGQVATPLIGNDAFQEADVTGITRQATKHNYLVKRVEDLPRVIREAFHIATTGRPGPVLIDLPKDVTVAEIPFVWPESIELRGYKPTFEGNDKQISRAVDMLLAAKKPLLYVGGGTVISGAYKELTELAERLQIPVTMTLMGLGSYPGDGPLSLSMLGMHGTYAANMAMTYCDTVMAVGARFDDRVTGRVNDFSIYSQKIQIDVDPSSIGKNVPVDLPVVGDVRNVLQKMLVELDKRGNAACQKASENYSAWRQECEDWKAKFPLYYDQASESDILSPYVVDMLYKLTKDRKTIIATEVGQHQMYAAQFYHFASPRRWLTSGGLGTMGYGFPAAIGAQVAEPDALVIDVAGDGSIQMNIQELALCAEFQLPVKILVLNNSNLGMVRQWQEMFFNKRYNAIEFPPMFPDYVKLADAYGATGLRCTKPEEVEDAIRQMIETPGPVMLDVRVKHDENVFPMIPAGGSIREPIIGPHPNNPNWTPGEMPKGGVPS